MSSPLYAHVIDTGLGAGNIGDDAMFLAAHRQLGPEFMLSTEIHSLKRAEVLPRGVEYLCVEDPEAIEESIRSANLVFLSGGTPVMDQWGLQWPLLANAKKLRLCHEVGKPVHALGVGVDRLKDPEGLRIFQECYSPIASWSVRSKHGKRALLEMGVPAEKIVRGARHPRNNREWPAVGIFAQRGKNRPNRIGSTICRVVGRSESGRALIVRELDAVEGTPVLDIKPVMAEFLPRGELRQPEWSRELMRNYWATRS